MPNTENWEDDLNGLSPVKKAPSIPVKAVEGVEDEKSEGEQTLEDLKTQVRKKILHIESGTIYQFDLANYLASLEYRINQLEKQQ